MTTITKLGILFYLMGIFFICFETYSFHKKSQIYNENIKVTADIVSIKNCKKPSHCYNLGLAYSVDGKNYDAKILKVPYKEFRNTKSYYLYVDPNDPSEYIIGEPEIPIPLEGMFLTFFGFLAMYPAYKKGKKFRHLKRNGKLIKSKVIFVGLNENYHDSNNGHPFKVEAEFVDPFSGKSIVVSENMLWKDPNQSGLISSDNMVEVLYDPKNPKSCMMIYKELTKIKMAS
jgi:hypothetical protein